MSLPLCVLALTLGTAIGAARGSCRCASALAALGVVWILANGPMEGHVLWTLDSEHGLTSADLLTIPILTLAGWRLWRSAPPLVAPSAQRRVTRRRSAASLVRLSTGGPGGASGD
ncbi:hypothetical protein [Cryptosporangium sp. NPDC048952]|uniref:hypothetical protein n=1 Tax=Cryptosporangium sp. NPDC048952 TaxID=3363961 RepID=UPI0037159367